MKKLNLIGRRFGRLLVLSPGPANWYGGSITHTTWKCKCDCGNKSITETEKLRSGHTISCGCAWQEVKNRGNLIHGGCVGKPCKEYVSWAAAIDRCENPKNKIFKNYGGRGIKICNRWRSSYANFFSDMGPRPSKLHSLDRYPKVDGHYEPNNCRWATFAEQASNKRTTIWISLPNGSRVSLAEYASMNKIDYHCMYRRYVLDQPLTLARRPVKKSNGYSHV